MSRLYLTDTNQLLVWCLDGVWMKLMISHAHTTDLLLYYQLPSCRVLLTFSAELQPLGRRS
jgi:hypothetical protein